MPSGVCECGCGQEAADSFAPGHDSEALRMLLDLDGVIHHDEPVADFLRRRGYGPDARDLTREYRDRLFDDTPPPPADGSRLQPGQLTGIAHRVGTDVLKRSVEVGPQHRNQLGFAKAPQSPASTCSARTAARSSSARISNFYTRMSLYRSSHPRLSTLAGKIARIQTGQTASKSNRSASSALHRYDTDDALRDAFDEAVDPIGAMDLTHITLPENEVGGAL